jgi:Winged helix DNA-binding domain
MAVAEIGLRRLASQRIAGDRCEHPADVVRWLGALQAQDYHQALWAVGSRTRAGTLASVERALSERQIVRTWLMRGTIHFAPPEDVRWLLALLGPRLAVAAERRREHIGLSQADIARAAELLSTALAGDRRLSRPDVMELLERNGIATTGGHGYHILWRLSREGLICIGPTEAKQQTFALLDDWAPRAESRELSREQSLALLAGRFALSRGPVTAHDLARWAGITVSDARAGLEAADGLVCEGSGGGAHWLDAAGAGRAPTAAERRRAYLLAGFDEFLLGYGDRDAILDPAHAGRVVPGANGVFRPMIVCGGRIVGTWSRSAGKRSLAIDLQPFDPPARTLLANVALEAARYRTFLGLPSSAEPVVTCDGAAS